MKKTIKYLKQLIKDYEWDIKHFTTSDNRFKSDIHDYKTKIELLESIIWNLENNKI